MFIHAKQGNIAIQIIFHFIYKVIICIQHSIAVIKNGFGHHCFYFCHCFCRMNSTKSNMISCDISDYCHFTILKSKT